MTDRELDKALGVKEWGVFLHAWDGKPSGQGYVPRPIDPLNGHAVDQRNYGTLDPVRVFKRHYAAERHANALTYAE